MSFDHLNSQPLGFGVGHFQTSFGLGDESGDELLPPFVYLPPEELRPPPTGAAFGFNGPGLCGFLEEVSFECKVPLGTSFGQSPEVFAISLARDLEARRQALLGTYLRDRSKVVGKVETSEKNRPTKLGTSQRAVKVSSIRKMTIKKKRIASRSSTPSRTGRSPKISSVKKKKR
jgi:hypothetical protein